MNINRLNKLQHEMSSLGLDGIALIPGPNMFYISGIQSHPSERPFILLLPADGQPAIIIPTLEAMKAEAAGIDPNRIFGWTDTSGYPEAFRQAVTQLDLNNWRLGVEKLHMRVLEFELLHQAAPNLQIAHADPVLNALRLVKDIREIAAMEKAVSVAERGLAALLPRIRIGMTEKQIAAMLTQELFSAGADALSFQPIVATGANSASPHAMPSDQPTKEGDLLVIDWGVYVDNYPSDITRTFAVGDIEEEYHIIYQAVKRANEQGRMACQPGTTGEEVDQAAREVIEEAGYGPYFIHRTGHGLGLEIHEEPNMVVGNTKPLDPGNVFTIEPGIYLPGRGGVRIEDNIYVTPSGHRSLTSFSRDLITVGTSK